MSAKNALILQAAQDAGGSKTLFVDTGVYTRNRAFRLYLSSKAGKDALLLPTGSPLPTFRRIVKLQRDTEAVI